MQLTAGQSLRDKLERARDLMRHRNPSGDLAVVIERALDELLATLEKERLAKTRRTLAKTPPIMSTGASGRPTKAGHVSRAVRREVFERDGERCTFLADDGARCPSRTLLELDHVTSKGLGGSDAASNLRVRCRAHNRLHAEDVFGKDHVAQSIHLRHLRHRKSAGAEADTAEPLDVAMRGLLHLGFARSEARRALDDISRRHANDFTRLPLEHVLREAVAALT